MNSEELFYLRDSRTEKYHSSSGLTESKEDAVVFTMAQLHSRLGVAKTHINKFKEKLKNGYMVTEPVAKRETGLKIESSIEYQPEDMLLCDGYFYLGKKIGRKPRMIYSQCRNIIRYPSGYEKSEKVVLKVIRVVGKVNAD